MNGIDSILTNVRGPKVRTYFMIEFMYQFVINMKIGTDTHCKKKFSKFLQLTTRTRHIVSSQRQI